MTQTFDLFLYGTDSEIGYPADDYRLVQAWAWYSLSDDQQYNGYLWLIDDVCEPNPCPPVAIEETTWGKIKAGFK